MNPANHYSTMTDDQLAQWHQLTTEVDRLRAELAQVKREREEEREAQNREYDQWCAQMADRAETIVDLTQKEATQRSMNRRSAAALMEALGALKQLVDCLTADKMEMSRRYWGGEVFRALEHAQEVAAAHGIPF